MIKKLMTTVVVASLFLPRVYAQEHDHTMHMQHMQQQQGNTSKPVPAKNGPVPAKDTRQVVHFPKALREHTLTNMRDHLLALQQIQAALSKQDYDLAGDIAEQRLGMTALSVHGAHEVAKYMPKGMQEAGSGMHRNASRFAIAAKDVSATGDVKPALEALSNVTAQCVACHAGYRLR
jgi:hypothetical protein